MPIKLRDETVTVILESRRLGRPELCIESVQRWLKELAAWHTDDEHLREDLVQECLLYFIEAVYRWLEPRGMASVRAVIEILMNRRIMTLLRNQRTRSRMRGDRIKPRTDLEQDHTDFSSVFVQEVLSKNQGSRRQAVLKLLLVGYTPTEIGRLLKVDRKTVLNIRTTMVI